MAKVHPDPVDAIVVQWRRERPELDLELLELVGRVRLAEAALTQRLEALARRHGLSRGLLDVLAALRRAGAPYRMTPTDLFNSMMVTSGGMTHRLDKLEQAGLIERCRHPEDRRAVPVSLTARGRKLIDAVMPESLEELGALKTALTRAERDALLQGLRKLLQALG